MSLTQLDLDDMLGVVDMEVQEEETTTAKWQGKPMISLDFDGVCHSYTSGWQGADTVLDPPVEGLFEFLKAAAEYFVVCIYSVRSKEEAGREAMKAWFELWLPGATEEFDLRFPDTKPPAFVGIDDRVITFTGAWPTIETLTTFKPWNRQ